MKRTAARLGACLLPALLFGACGGSNVPSQLPYIKGPDGKEYLLLDRGQYKGFYDPWGKLQRIDYDGNGHRDPRA